MSFVDLSADAPEDEDEVIEPTLGEELPAEPGLPPLPEDDDDAGWERQARTMGWHPQGKYRGDPRRWVPAKEYVETAYREFPVMRERLRRMVEKDAKRDDELASVNRRLDEQTTATRTAMAAARRAEQVGYDRAKSELVERRRAAVAAGDEETFDAVEAEIAALDQQRAAEPEPVAEPAAEPAPREEPPSPAQPSAEVKAFVTRNPWFNDAKLKHVQQAMIALHIEVGAEHPEWSMDDQLDEALERLTASFPGRFTPEYANPAAEPEPMPREPAPAPVPRPRRAAPTVPAPRRAAGSAIDQIPDPEERAQAKSAFAGMKRADPGFTEAEYMLLYNNPHLDVLEIRAQRKT